MRTGHQGELRSGYMRDRGSLWPSYRGRELVLISTTLIRPLIGISVVGIDSVESDFL